MNKLLLGGAAAAAIFAIAPALAQTTAAPAPAPAPETQTQIQVMHMPTKTETRDDVVTHVRDMFAKLDTNKDGFITREEADAAHKLMAGDLHKEFAERGTMPDRNARFDQLDTNKDGQISRQEYVSAQPQVFERRVMISQDGKPGDFKGGKRMRGMGMRMHGRMFESADANKDGKVSLQEMQTAALQHFDSADTNHDGKLTPEERMQMHQRMRAEHQRPA